jgi:hypothetical protein
MMIKFKMCKARDLSAQLAMIRERRTLGRVGYPEYLVPKTAGRPPSGTGGEANKPPRHSVLICAGNAAYHDFISNMVNPRRCTSQAARVVPPVEPHHPEGRSSMQVLIDALSNEVALVVIAFGALFIGLDLTFGVMN